MGGLPILYQEDRYENGENRSGLNKMVIIEKGPEAFVELMGSDYLCLFTTL
jgi:hypothetical protein